MSIRRLPLLALLLPLFILAPGCSSDDEPEPELVYHEEFPIPLADLAGAYMHADEPQDDPPRSRESTFGIPAQVEGFRQLRLVVVGGGWSSAVVETAFDVGGAVFYDTLTVSGLLDFRLTVADDPEKVYRAVIVPEDDAFVASALIWADWPGGSVDPADLLLTSLDVALVCRLDIGDEERILESAHGELASVRLELLDADVLEAGT